MLRNKRSSRGMRVEAEDEEESDDDDNSNVYRDDKQDDNSVDDDGGEDDTTKMAAAAAKKAQEEGFGAYLLDEEHWPRVFGLVAAMRAALDVPVFCKIRLLPTLSRSIAFARGLQAAGPHALLHSDGPGHARPCTCPLTRRTASG